jgi:ankyrin repeat protein
MRKKLFSRILLVLGLSWSAGPAWGDLTPEEQAFLDAARDGDVAAVRQFLAGGVNVNARDIYGTTALHCVIDWNQIEVAGVLLEVEGIEVNAGNFYGTTTLHWAAMYGWIEIARMLLSKGAKVNVKNAAGDTPLHTAATYDQPEIVEILLEHPEIDINAKNKDNETAMHLAVMRGNAETVRRLLGKGAEVNAKDKDGYTALYWAVRGGDDGDDGDEEVVAMLLERPEIDVNIQDDAGDTALHVAAKEDPTKKGHNNIVKMLLNFRGIIVDIKNNDGKTAEEEANACGHVEIVSLLRR